MLLHWLHHAVLDDGAPEGAVNRAGNVIGSYLHGLLASPAMRGAMLARIGVAGSGIDYSDDVDAALDDIAADISAHVDIDALIDLARAGA